MNLPLDQHANDRALLHLQYVDVVNFYCWFSVCIYNVKGVMLQVFGVATLNVLSIR